MRDKSTRELTYQQPLKRRLCSLSLLLSSLDSLPAKNSSKRRGCGWWSNKTAWFVLIIVFNRAGRVVRELALPLNVPGSNRGHVGIGTDIGDLQRSTLWKSRNYSLPLFPSYLFPFSDHIRPQVAHPVGPTRAFSWEGALILSSPHETRGRLPWTPAGSLLAWERWRPPRKVGGPKWRLAVAPKGSGPGPAGVIAAWDSVKRFSWKIAQMCCRCCCVQFACRAWLQE